MLKDITSYDGIYLACGITDLRLSVDGLSIFVKLKFKMDPFDKYASIAGDMRFQFQKNKIVVNGGELAW